jgi:hypothetical protein
VVLKSLLNLETRLLIGVALIALGFATAIWAEVVGKYTGFGALSSRNSLRMSVPSILALSLGTSLIFNSLNGNRRKWSALDRLRIFGPQM